MILILALCAFLCCVLEVQCQCVHPLLGARRIFTEKTVPKGIYQDGDIIHYKCADGYSFKDSSTPYHRSECYNHVWTPSLFKCYDYCGNKCKAPSTCHDGKCTCSTCGRYGGKYCDQIVRCKKLPKPNIGDYNIIRSSKNTTWETSCTLGLDTVLNFTCPSSYKIAEGNPVARCMADGWDRVPVCQPNTCKELKISNGYMRFQERVYNGGRLPVSSIVKFICIPGYKLVEGPTMVSCRMDGATASWSAFPPKCLTIRQFRNRCAEENKEAVLESGKCRYKSPTSPLPHETEQHNHATGKTGKPLTIVRSQNQEQNSYELKCSSYIPLSLQQHGTLSSHSPYYPGTVVKFSCDRRYHLDGPATSQCGSGGVWQNPWPNCQPNTCKELKISNGYMRFEGRVYKGGRLPIDSIVMFTCNIGYKLVEGPTRVSCRMDDATASWSAFPPKCLTIQQIRNRCAEKNKEAVFESGKWFCRYKSPTSPLPHEKEQHNHATGKSGKPLIIVMATAGGLLLILFFVITLVAFQRKRLRRRSRGQGGCRRLSSDADDRFSFVYYSNDVHIVLPSYDEAMQNRLSAIPPPYAANDNNENLPTLPALPGSSETPDSITATREDGQRVNLNAHRLSGNIYEAIEDVSNNMTNTIRNVTASQQTIQPAKEAASLAGATQHSVANARSPRDGEVEDQDEEENAGNSLLESSTQKPLYARLSSVKRRQMRNTKTGRHSKSRRHSKIRREGTEALLGENSSAEDDDDDADKPLEAGADVTNGNDVTDNNKSG